MTKMLHHNLEKIDALLSIYQELVDKPNDSEEELKRNALKVVYAKNDLLKLIISTKDLLNNLEETENV